MGWCLYLAVCMITLSFYPAQCQQVEVIEGTDRDLNEAISTTDYVLAFIYVGDCIQDPCKAASKTVDKVASHTYMNGLKIIKLKDSEEALKYSLTRFPALIFYRRSVPILYDVELMESDSIVEWLDLNRESVVQELTDESFEHLTQATTGATTGDWMILFYNSDCNMYIPQWQGVGVRLKHTMNTAVVDSSVQAGVVKRLHITACPTVLLLKKGQMYAYSGDMRINSLVDFASEFYVKVKPEPIPKEPSPFDDLMPKIVKLFKGGPLPYALVGLLAVALLAILLVCRKPKKAVKTE